MTNPQPAITNADQAIEACAKVADARTDHYAAEYKRLQHSNSDHAHYVLWEMGTAKEISTAIRSLKDQVASPSDAEAREIAAFLVKDLTHYLNGRPYEDSDREKIAKALVSYAATARSHAVVMREALEKCRGLAELGAQPHKFGISPQGCKAMASMIDRALGDGAK